MGENLIQNIRIDDMPPQLIANQNLIDYMSIPQFYAGRSVFITGGTGFIGKVLIEKLLRSCRDIKNIYLLIRPKCGENASGRLLELLHYPIFENIPRQQLNKIIPIAGNVAADELGISKNDQAMLCRTVSIVFHSAASVRFNEKLKVAVAINMLGTKHLVELCHRMVSLDALIHVSTAYSNCDRPDISENIYPPPYCPEDIISLVKWLPEDLLDKLTSSLIGKHPNTYTFTKALAEHMLLKAVGNMPTAIVRPSIVIGSLNEPTSGWIDNFNGPTALVCAVGKGLLRTCACKRDCVADLVPVDIVVNLIIASAWRTAREKSDNCLVYNCCTGQRQPITWGRFVDNILVLSRKQPVEKCVFYPDLTYCSNRHIYNYLVHYIPAHCIDIVLRLLGKKPFVVNVQNKISSATGGVNFFTGRQWRFKDNNVQNLLSMMSSMDRTNFVFDVRRIDWEKYLERYVLGIRKHLLKQHPESLPACRKRVLILYFMHQSIKMLSVVFIWRFVIARSKRLRVLWNLILKIFLEKLRIIMIC